MKVYSLVDSSVLPKAYEYHRSVGDERVDCNIASIDELKKQRGLKVIKLKSGFNGWSSLFVAEKGHFLQAAFTCSCTYATTYPTDKVAVLDDDDVLIEDSYNVSSDDYRSEYNSLLEDAFYYGPGSGKKCIEKMTSLLKYLGDTPSLNYWKKWIAGDSEAGDKFRQRVKAPVIH